MSDTNGKKKSKGGVWQFIKFALFSASAGIIQVVAFYLVFTPISTLIGNHFTSTYSNLAGINYIVLGCTMACNMITEFLYDKFVVFKNQENTAVKKEK